MIVFGTGKLFEELDRSDGTVQSVYAVREENIASPTAVLKSSLRQLTLSEETNTAGKKVRILNGVSSFSPTTDRGWYFDLTVGGVAAGERVLVTPIEQFGFANFTSYIPTGLDLCRPGGQSFFYRLDVTGNLTRESFNDTALVAGLLPGSALRAVGVEVLPTISAPILLQERSAETANTTSSISGTSLGSFSAPPRRSAATRSCQIAKGQSTSGRPWKAASLGCPGPAIRVWRELPGSIDRN
jgi:Tfp pilus tip-associated adhesin PilY1